MRKSMEELIAITIVAGGMLLVISIIFTEVLGDTKALIAGIAGAAFMIYSAIIFHAIYVRGNG